MEASNALERFTPQDINTLYNRIADEDAKNEANDIIKRMETIFRSNARNKVQETYMSLTENYLWNHMLHPINLKHLTTNGFRVYKIRHMRKGSSEWMSMIFITWDVKDFETEVFKPFTATYQSTHTNFNNAAYNFLRWDYHEMMVGESCP